VNRTLAGEVLTNKDLAALALEHGLVTPEALANRLVGIHSEAGQHSLLTSLTAELRHRMFLAGELSLRTETFEPGPAPEPDLTLIAFLTK
jgi:hypothetical protein